jgi:hypothetical protein
MRIFKIVCKHKQKIPVSNTLTQTIRGKGFPVKSECVVRYPDKFTKQKSG